MPQIHLSSLLRWISLTVLFSVIALIVWNFRIPPRQETVSIPVEGMGKPAPLPTSGPERTESREKPEDVVEETIGFEVEETRAGAKSFLLRADRSITLEGGLVQLEGVALDIYQGPGTGLRVVSREGTFRAGLNQVQLRGDVHVWRDEKPLLSTEILDYSENPMQLYAPSRVEFSTDEISGTGTAMWFHPDTNLLEIDGPVQFRYRPDLPGIGEIQGRCWNLTYHLDRGTAILNEDAVLRQGDFVLRAWNLEFRTAGGTGPELFAHKAVFLDRKGSGISGPRTSWSDYLHARSLSPDHLDLSTLELAGEVRAIDGNREVRGAAASYRNEEGRGFRLRSGDGGARAQVSTVDRQVQADRIDILPGQDLHALGNVETHFRGGTGKGPGTLFPFASDDPILVYSGELLAAADGSRVLFSQGVIAWQGERQIQARRIRVEGQGMEATHEVLTRFPLAAGESARENPEESHVTIRSGRMWYDDQNGFVRYEDDARMDRGRATIHSDSILAEIDPGGGGGGIDRVILEGHVRLQRDSQVGFADHGLYLPLANRLILKGDGDLVELRDLLRGRMVRSRELTLDLSDDSLMAETGHKGRLLITLIPGSGERDSIEADVSD